MEVVDGFKKVSVGISTYLWAILYMVVSWILSRLDLSVSHCKVCNMSDTLLVLRNLLVVYHAALLWIISS